MVNLHIYVMGKDKTIAKKASVVSTFVPRSGERVEIEIDSEDHSENIVGTVIDVKHTYYIGTTNSNVDITIIQ